MSEYGADDFPLAFRGYEKEHVDRFIRQLKDRIDLAETQNSLVSEDVRRLQGEVMAANARADDAEGRLERLAAEVHTLEQGQQEDAAPRVEFEQILRVAEDQANEMIANAVKQGEKFTQEARAEAEKIIQDAQDEAGQIRQQAQHELEQARIRIETEQTAARAQIEQDAAVAAQEVQQAQQEAAATHSEAERDAAAIRARAEADAQQVSEQAQRQAAEARARQLEFETALTRREDQAQQEFLALHNQAVAHSERIIQDANEKVQRALEHSQRVETNAKAFEAAAHAQADSVIANARTRAGEIIEGARARAQAIIDTVVAHAKAAGQDAEDRARSLRAQQQSLQSFLTEVNGLVGGIEDYQRSTALADDASEVPTSEEPGEPAPAAAPAQAGGDTQQ